MTKLGNRIRAVATAAVIGLLCTSIGCATAWPTVSGLTDPAFHRQERLVRTVDVLPVDVQVWTYRGSKHDPHAVAAGLDEMVSAMVQNELAERGYDIMALLDWEGMFDGPQGPAQAMDAEAMAVTALSLSSYGLAQAKHGKRSKQILPPHVPVPLGAETGSDATLYVGGWAYSGKQESSNTGAKIALGVLVGVLVVGVIVLAIAGGKGGKGGKGGGVAKGVGKAAAAVGKGIGRAAGGFGRVAGRVFKATARGVLRAGVTIGKRGPRIALETLDAFGRAGFNTHIHIQPTRVNYYRRRSTPRKGASAMLLEMTLIDNRTGRTLWHARRRFPASPRSGKHVHKAVHRLMASLPEATGGAPGTF